MTKHADIVIVGGGLAGLVAAALAAEPVSGRSPRVVVLEGAQPGGRARTDERGGFLFNQGPHALYLQGAGRQVMLGLGIDPKGGPPDTKHGWVWHEGAAHPMPTSAPRLLASKLLGTRAKAQLGTLLTTTIAKIDPSALATTSTAEWLDGLELHPEVRLLLKMLVRISSYVDPDVMPLSADAGVRQLQMALAGGVRYIDGGWQTMVRALLDICAARGVEVRAKATVLGTSEQSESVTVTTADGAWDASAVVIASGGPAAAVGLLGADPGWGDLSDPVTAACLDLGVTRPPAKPVMWGLADPLYLSTHCPPADLAPAGGAVVHALRYGARDADTDSAELHHLAQAAGIASDTIAEERFLARMHVAWSVPTAATDGLAGRPGVAVPGRTRTFVAGDWVGDVGLLADAAIASGAAAAAASRTCIPSLAAAR